MAQTKKVSLDFREVENDLYINPVTGDLEFEDADNQNIIDVLSAFPGHYKEFPAVGAGVSALLKGKVNFQKVEATTKEQLEADGYRALRPTFTITQAGQAIIKPNATRIRF